MERADEVKKGIAVEWISLLWMVIEASVAIGAGILAHSLSLVAFGADSVIELIAGLVLLWRLYVEQSGADARRVERAERKASWIVGVALLLLSLYILVTAIHELWTGKGAESSGIGLALTMVSAILMPLLARAKVKIGERIGSKALKADGICSIVCAYMAWTVLAGMVLTAWFGWWWADAAAALALIYFLVKEGLEAVKEAQGMEDT
jgi:divalent metal cation (Fe/Co/Zn/Cd) transporter